jgi:hypothetical protein
MEENLILFPNDSVEMNYQELYESTFEQIKKDFYPHVDLGEMPSPLNAEVLKEIVEKSLDKLLREEPQSLGAVLYRMDVNEKATKAAIASSKVEDSTRILAFRILKREAQKVWLRKTLS